MFEESTEYPVTKEILITNNDSSPFEIQSVKAYRPYLEASYSVIEKGKKFKVLISQTKPSGAVKREATTVRVVTDRLRSPNLNIRVLTPPSEKEKAIVPAEPAKEMPPRQSGPPQKPEAAPPKTTE